MSRTDQHAPYWVKMYRGYLDTPDLMETQHWCDGKECKFTVESVKERRGLARGFCYPGFSHYGNNLSKSYHYSHNSRGWSTRIDNRMHRRRVREQLRSLDPDVDIQLPHYRRTPKWIW